MQKKVQIVSDGSLDLPQEITDAHDIEVVPFYVSFNGETYQKEIEEIGIREFYQEMVDHPDVFPKSSMPSVDDFYQTFVKSAKEICCVSASVLRQNSVVPCNLQRLQKRW